MEIDMKYFRNLCLVVTVVVLAGCTSHKGNKDVSSTGSAVPAAEATVAPDANATSSAGSGAGMSTGAEAPAARVIYFDFDSSEIKPEYNGLLTAQARYLARNASTRVRLEGNTDERGSREYNIGLGERRAQAVRRALQLQGVAESQLTTVSFGEEKPAVAGTDEAAWAKNRRVEFGYAN
jgi:peptidoglycan-associated lipoprotein